MVIRKSVLFFFNYLAHCFVEDLNAFAGVTFCSHPGDVMVMGTLPQQVSQARDIKPFPSNASLLWTYDFLGSYESHGWGEHT